MLRFKLPVVLIFVCACKCLAMSSSELEDFANFLKKTSQLSPTLKKGVNADDDYDEDELVSDNAWEESGKFEGDLVLNERQRRFIVEEVAEGLSRNGINDGTKRWPNNEVIYYIQKEHFSSDQEQAIQSGIDDLTRASCITFRPYRKGDRDAVVIQGSRRGCFSQVGYQGGYQVLNLFSRHPVGRGCFRHGTVVHEMLHTLGFYHMQSSPDRDDYVNVLWKNIVQPARHNFRKYNSFAVSDFGVGYDYDSVLHYSRRAFSANGQDTIVPKKVGAQIGQRLGLSDKDVQKLNKMYCDADSNVDDDYGANPQSTEKTEVMNKNTKDKPFDGHGIGYHQGKAVVIKLLPAPETYKLPDVPSFHVFDYFSKAPQTLSTPQNQGFRTGKEIAYSFNPPEPPAMEELKSTVYYGNLEIESTKEESKPPEIITNNGTAQSDNSEKYISSETEEPVEQTENLDPHLIDAFERLSKIIKLHVYPSQRTNLKNIYMVSDDNHKKSDPLQNTVSNEFSVLPRDESMQKINGDAAVDYIKNLNHLNAYELEQEFNYYNPEDNYSDELLEKRNKKSRDEFINNEAGDAEDISYKSFPYYAKLDHEPSSLFDYALPLNNDGFYRKVYSPKAIEDKNLDYRKNNHFDDTNKERWYSAENLKNNPYDHGIWQESDDMKNGYKYFSTPEKPHDYFSLYRVPTRLFQKWSIERR